MQRRDIARRLAEGVSAKLDFDYVCERGNSFSEYYLHGAINEIVAALVSPTDYRINSGYAHSALQRTPGAGSGRQREVDFYVEPYDSGNAGLVIEAKWAESSHCRWDRVLLDLCRLTLIKESGQQAECLFVLAGSSAKVAEVFQSLQRNLPARPGKGKSTGVLEIPGENDFPNRRAYRLRDWAGRFAGNQTVLDGLPLRKNGRPNVPVAVVSTLAKSSTSATQSWQTVVWRISARQSD